MTVDRTHVGHQTRYELRDGGELSCILTYGGAEIEPAAWKILLPGPGGTQDLYGAQRLTTPHASVLEAWLAPIIGQARATELVDAVDAEPPRNSGWRQQEKGTG